MPSHSRQHQRLAVTVELTNVTLRWVSWAIIRMDEILCLAPGAVYPLGSLCLHATIRAIAFFPWPKPKPRVPQHLVNMIEAEATQSHGVPGFASAAILPAGVHAAMHVALDVTPSR
eukprot:16442886-Heterocapsa_arctica.AAC.1